MVDMPTHILLNLWILFEFQHSSVANNTSNPTGATESADDDLPSVMTCANYLKLPPYSTKVCFFLLFGELWLYHLCSLGNLGFRNPVTKELLDRPL